jgi:hypothetical protein
MILAVYVAVYVMAGNAVPSSTLIYDTAGKAMLTWVQVNAALNILVMLLLLLL